MSRKESIEKRQMQISKIKENTFLENVNEYEAGKKRNDKR
jgi:hypothetical protein